jgi:hypothetical protein
VALRSLNRMENMNTLVMTTVNPFNKLEHQKLCFMTWKKLGYTIKTFNSSREIDMLLNAGFDKNDIIEIEVSETSKELFNKEIPRILPIITRAINLNYEAYLLTNADIYPAHRKVISTYLASLNSSIALARNECVYLASNKYTDSSPYRGGLDTFFFTRIGLTNIFNELLKEDVSERMTFGIPGWDYYLGHLILENGGSIMDGEVVLHQSHQTTYGKIDEFQFYANVMAKRGQFLQTEINAVAAEFARKIHNECESNQYHSTLLKRMFYETQSIKDIELYDADVDIILKEIEKAVQNNGIEINVTKALRGFIKSQLEGVSWVAAEAFIKNEMRGIPIIQSSFILLSIQLIVKKLTNKLKVTYQYPDGNMHGVALRQILNNAQGIERMRNMIGLFSSELVEHNIFNKDLYKYFVLSADSQKKLSSCASILTICSKG